MTKVLHITSWYPNDENPFEAIWIKKLIDSLDPFVEDQAVYHIQVKPSKKFRYTKKKPENDLLKKQLIIELPTKSWFIIELSNFFMLFWQLKVKRINKGYDVINFHIAYPQWFTGSG
jgi:hypothetical protein